MKKKSAEPDNHAENVHTAADPDNKFQVERAINGENGELTDGSNIRQVSAECNGGKSHVELLNGVHLSF